MKVIASVQVRLNSKRLKNKALKNIHDRTSLEWVIKSIESSELVDDLIVATTSDESDDELVDFLISKNIKYYRGDELNVAKRLYDAGMSLGADHIVRIVGDHPLNSFELLDFILKEHIVNKNDYTSLNRDKIAVGVLSEVISVKAFEKLFNYNLDFSMSEYLTYFFTNNNNIFKVKLLDPPKKFESKKYRLTLDNQDDYEMLEKLIQKLVSLDIDFTHENILNTLNENPEIWQTNFNIQQKFMSEDFQNKIFKASKIIV